MVLCVFGVLMLPACGHVQVVLLPVFERIGPEGLFRVDVGGEKVVALTIDDGPSAHTDEILDLLAGHGATATFFIHTDHLDALGPAGEEVVRRILDEGHELGNHTAADVPSVALSPGAFVETFSGADKRLREFEVEPRWFRAAGGSYRPEDMLPMVRDAGYEPTFVMGSFLPWDTFLHLPVTYGNQVGNAIFPGAIVVLHEGHGELADRGPRTLKSLRALISAAQGRGYRLQTLSEVVDRTN
ncbi:MAG: polysaccharide deacetylase family protein [Planctomycetota bacterium]